MTPKFDSAWSMAEGASALYVHVPFCPRKCSYCAFCSREALPGEPEVYLEALERELGWLQRPGRLNLPLRTLYMGGGTPSALPLASFRKLLALGRSLLGEDKDYEWTLEVNPGTLGVQRSRMLVEYGVNRVSLGVQAGQDDLLATLGRIHDSRQALRAVADLRRAGIRNVNLDLLLAIPGQTCRQWRETLEMALELNPVHVSLYNLVAEPGTPLGEKMLSGTVALPTEAEEVAMYLLGQKMTEGAGLLQYEIANFARAGWECRHNLNYWHNEPYLGCGPGAHSSSGSCRWWNHRDLDEYAGALDREEWPVAGYEELSRPLQQAETIFLGLRLTRGLSRKRFRQRFGCDVTRCFPDTITRLVDEGLLECRENWLRLTPRGRMLANHVMAEFLP